MPEISFEAHTQILNSNFIKEDILSSLNLGGKTTFEPEMKVIPHKRGRLIILKTTAKTAALAEEVAHRWVQEYISYLKRLSNKRISNWQHNLSSLKKIINKIQKEIIQYQQRNIPQQKENILKKKEEKLGEYKTEIDELSLMIKTKETVLNELPQQIKNKMNKNEHNKNSLDNNNNLPIASGTPNFYLNNLQIELIELKSRLKHLKDLVRQLEKDIPLLTQKVITYNYYLNQKKQELEELMKKYQYLSSMVNITKIGISQLTNSVTILNEPTPYKIIGKTLSFNLTLSILGSFILSFTLAILKENIIS